MIARALALVLATSALVTTFAPAASASVPGIAGRIAFTSTRDGNAELYSVWPDGSAIRRLTWTTATEQAPAYSPDLYGTMIAYESDASGRFRIHSMDWDGSHQRQVSPEASEAFDDIQPTWSPNSKRIAFASTRGGAGWHIWTMNADGTDLQRVAEGVDPAWSSTGTIAFARGESIWLVEPDGSNLRRFTEPAGGAVAAPAWNPGTHEIVFSRFRQDGYPGDLFIASRFFPGQERQLTTGGFHNARPSWSPDEREIVFQRRAPGVDAWQLMVIRRDGTGLRELQPSGGGDLTPGWGSSAFLPSGIEPAAPSIRIDAPEDGRAFWQGQEVAAYYECESATSLIVSCTGDVPVGEPLDTSTPGTWTFNVTAVDDEGRTATAAATYRVADTSDPEIELRAPQDGAIYELGEEVWVEYSCADAGSPIQFCDGTEPSGTRLETRVPGTFSFRVAAIDEAWNEAVEEITYHVVDRTAPSIAITEPSEGARYSLGDWVSPSYVCDDASWVASCRDEGVATDVPGAHTFTVWATDQYGNEAKLERQYYVTYPFSGFFAPLNGAGEFRAGESIPVKFALGGDYGPEVLSPGGSHWLRCSQAGEDAASTYTSGKLSYNAATGRYTYLVPTERAWSGACFNFVLALRDGTFHRATLIFKR